MRDPAPLAEARELIRAGRFDAAVERLVAALPDLPVEYHRQACAYAGLAQYFAAHWTESLGYFQSAARGSEVPEDWSNLAMAQVSSRRSSCSPRPCETRAPATRADSTSW